jgi:hypothetical protein
MPFAAFLFAKVYGTSRPVYLFFATLAIYFFLVPVSASPAGDQSYLDARLSSAREQRLSEDRYWEVLLHYKHHGSGRKSLIDDPRFFLAPDGKTDPAAELEATLRSFFRRSRRMEIIRCGVRCALCLAQGKAGHRQLRLPAPACTRYNNAMESKSPRCSAHIPYDPEQQPCLNVRPYVDQDRQQESE